MLFCQNCKQKLIFLKGHRENSHNEISRKYAHRYVSRSMQADSGAQTGTAEIIAIFRNFANAPKVRITSEALLARR
jgi:hypothetical protein